MILQIALKNQKSQETPHNKTSAIQIHFGLNIFFF